MNSTRLLVLGPPGLMVGGEPVRLDRKPVALLAWLALADGPVSRASLADLLWPDSSQAGVNLRKALTDIRLVAGGAALAEDMTRRTLAVGPGLWVDVRAFDQALAEVAAHGHADGAPCQPCMTRLGEALVLARGEFMAGFSLPDCPDLDDWQALHGQRLALRRIWALDRLALGAAARGDWAAALSRARERLALDPTDEIGQHLLARVLAWSGQRAAALLQLAACARILDAELGIGPSAATLALEDAIRADRLAPPPTAPDGPRQVAAGLDVAGLDVAGPDVPGSRLSSCGPATAPRSGDSAPLPIADRILVVDVEGMEAAPGAVGDAWPPSQTGRKIGREFPAMTPTSWPRPGGGATG